MPRAPKPKSDGAGLKPPDSPAPVASATPDGEPEEEYKVGYGKPPLHSRFKKGELPKGHRRKGSVSLTQLLRRELANNPIKAKEVVEKTIALALTGNQTALKMIWERNDGLQIQAIQTFNLDNVSEETLERLRLVRLELDAANGSDPSGVSEEEEE